MAELNGEVTMTIDKALELLNDRYAKHPNAWKSDHLDAIRLGISALARIKTLREQNGAANFPLVGETEG